MSERPSESTADAPHGRPAIDPSGPHAVETEELCYARPESRELVARIYRPADRSLTGLPAVIEVHGGAWFSGSRFAGRLYNRALAACGIVVVAIDFRMGPDSKHPAASADVAGAVRFARANAAALRIDPGRIGLVGSSSGGHLALLVGIRPDHPDHTSSGVVSLHPEGGEVGADVDARVRAVVALWPVSDPIGRYRYALSRIDEDPEQTAPFNARGLIAGHRAYFADEAAMEAASVPAIVAAGEAEALPPVLLVQPELDQNVPRAMSEGLARGYREAGGALDYALFPGQAHGFAHAPGESTDRCIAGMVEFLGRHL